METHYAAYGLDLVCSFALIGMEATTHMGNESPAMVIEARTPVELDRAWSGAAGPPLWRGRLGDGLDLVIEVGTAGDLLFVYGDRARFRLHQDLRQLDCAPEYDSLDWHRALTSKVLPAISVMRGYEGLHGAAVDSPEGVVAIMAPSGSGKSTLAVELLGRGWPLFADDVLILEDRDGTVLAHHGTPHVNVAKTLPGAIDPDALGETLGILAEERWLTVKNASADVRPVRMLCILQRGPELVTEARTLTSNPLLLAPYMLGLSTDTARQRSRFSLYADLMESTTLVQLTANLECQPAQLADLLEGALARRPEPTTIGV